jgi:hypothetical protein
MEPITVLSCIFGGISMVVASLSLIHTIIINKRCKKIQQNIINNTQTITNNNLTSGNFRIMVDSNSNKDIPPNTKMPTF